MVSLEKEVQETETKRESLKEELTALEEEAKEVIQRQEELRVSGHFCAHKRMHTYTHTHTHAHTHSQESVKQYEEVLQKLKQEVEAVEAEEALVQSKLMDAKHELEKYTTKLKENQQKIRHFQNEV